MLNISFQVQGDYHFPLELQACISKKLEAALATAGKVLPLLKDQIHFTMIPSASVIPETGQGGYCPNKSEVELRIDPWHKIPIEKIVDEHLVSSVFHELHHAARWGSVGWGHTAIEGAISEGLSTVFETQFAYSKPLWGMYAATDMVEELREILALSDHKMTAEEHRDWFIRHQDGRRWIAYRVGTYIIERAISNNPTETAASLVDTSARTIFEMAKLDVDYSWL